jgi:hypothetical protein
MQNEPAVNEASLKGLYDRVRGQVEHENELYNQRIIWLITMQAFLYATIGLLMQAKLQPGAEGWANQIDGFIALVCVLGTLVALVCRRLLHNAGAALRAMRARWESVAKDAPEDVLKYFPHVSGGDGADLRGRLFRSAHLPAFFAVGWLIAAAILLAHRWGEIAGFVRSLV